MSKRNKHKMSENFQSEKKEEEKEVLNSAEQETETAQDSTPKEAEEPQEKEETVEERLARSEAEIADLKDRLLRQMAEFDNYRKRTLKEKAELILNGGEKVITKILPVIDDFERAITNGQNTEDAQVLREGLELIFKKFLKILEGEGVERIETEGKDFNTDFHEAIAMVPGMGDDKKGKVIDCVQTGYTLNGKVIRFAKVAVGQ